MSNQHENPYTYASKARTAFPSRVRAFRMGKGLSCLAFTWSHSHDHKTDQSNHLHNTTSLFYFSLRLIRFATYGTLPCWINEAPIKNCLPKHISQYSVKLYQTIDQVLSSLHNISWCKCYSFDLNVVQNNTVIIWGCTTRHLAIMNLSVSWYADVTV